MLLPRKTIELRASMASRHIAVTSSLIVPLATCPAQIQSLSFCSASQIGYGFESLAG
jgi:hypothetical protein